MVGCKADVIRNRFKELYAEKLDEICLALNNEFEDVIIYVRNNDLYVDCSDFSQIDVKIT